MTLSEIIARLEAATGPDRRLDAEIACAVIFHGLRPAEADDHKEHQRGIPPQAGDIWCPTGFLMAGSYTRSIDDALTLVPDGWWIAVRVCKSLAQGTASCHCTLECDAYSLGRDMRDDEPSEVRSYNRPNPAIAICLAALRARSAP